MKKSIHKQMVRHMIQAAFFAVTNGYTQGFKEGKIYQGRNKALCVPGLNCYSCPGALNACPIGSLQAVLNSRQFSVSCYVLGFLMMFGALLGRFACGWLCPFGLVQDLLYKIPFSKKRKNLPGHQYLTKLKFVILLVFVFLLSALVKDITGLGQPWFCEYICPSGTLLAGIPLVILNPALRSAIGFKFLWKVFVLIVILLLAIAVYRPFCKYLCPLGALYGLCNPISLYRYQINQEACVTCGICQKACDMDIKVWETPNSIECIRCGKCKEACPQHAITSNLEEVGNKWKKKYVKNPDNQQTEKPAVKSFGVKKIIQILAGMVFLFCNLYFLMISMIPVISYMLSEKTFVGKTFFNAMLFFRHDILLCICIIPSFAAAVLLLCDKGDGMRVLTAYCMQKHILLVLLVNFIWSALDMNMVAAVYGGMILLGELIWLILVRLLCIKKKKHAIHNAAESEGKADG